MPVCHAGVEHNLFNAVTPQQDVIVCHGLPSCWPGAAVLLLTMVYLPDWLANLIGWIQRLKLTGKTDYSPAY
jgi:hypothetical protein